jgi:hypothetical protein
MKLTWGRKGDISAIYIHKEGTGVILTASLKLSTAKTYVFGFGDNIFSCDIQRYVSIDQTSDKLSGSKYL